MKMNVKTGPKWPLWSQEWLFQIHVFIERRKGELKYLNHCFYKMILNECTSPSNEVGRFLSELKGRPSNLSIIMVIRSIPGSTVEAKPQREFPNDCKNDRCATCRSQIHPESFGIQWNEQKNPRNGKWSQMLARDMFDILTTWQNGENHSSEFLKSSSHFSTLWNETFNF